MVGEANPNFMMEPYDWLAYHQLQAGTPDIFQITLSSLTASVVFRVGTTNISRSRRQVSGYNIHFLPIELAPPSILFALEGAQSAFRISNIVLSTGAPGPGGIATGTSTTLYGKPGYYFAAPVSQSGQESSYFAGPKMAPLPGGVIAAQTPPDVSDVDVDVVTEEVNGRSVRKLTFSAVVPSNGNGVVAVFINTPGSGGTPGARLPVTFTTVGGSGSGAEATAVINDTGGVGQVIMANTGAGYLTEPIVSVAGIAGTNMQAEVGPAAQFLGYQIYIDGYFGRPLREAQLIAGDVRWPGQRLSGAFYLLPDTPPTGGDIDFYFVSISTSGSRRVNPTSSPVFTLAGGLT